MDSHQHLVSARFVLTFDLQFDPATICPYLRYSVSYRKIKLWQIITFEDNFMNVKTHIALNSEVRITTQFRKHFIYLLQVRYINKKISFAGFILGKNSLLFTKQLHIMIMTTG